MDQESRWAFFAYLMKELKYSEQQEGNNWQSHNWPRVKIGIMSKWASVVYLLKELNNREHQG